MEESFGDFVQRLSLDLYIIIDNGNKNDTQFDIISTWNP